MKTKAEAEKRLARKKNNREKNKKKVEVETKIWTKTKKTNLDICNLLIFSLLFKCLPSHSQIYCKIFKVFSFNQQFSTYLSISNWIILNRNNHKNKKKLKKIKKQVKVSFFYFVKNDFFWGFNQFFLLSQFLQTFSSATFIPFFLAHRTASSFLHPLQFSHFFSENSKLETVIIYDSLHFKFEI